MKKIALLCNYRLLDNRIGGMDVFFWAFDHKCKQEGYEVFWYFPNAATHEKYRDLNIISAGNQSIELRFIEDINAHKRSFDFIITHFLELCTKYFKTFKRLTGAQIIAVDHNPRPISGYPLTKRIRKRINGYLFSNYIDLFVGVSQYTRTELIRDFGKGISQKTIVIYNGIDVNHVIQKKNREKHNPTFLVACHLRESKGIQDLIEAVKLLPGPIQSQLHIDIYGDGPYRSTLEQLVITYRLQSQFTFHGSSNRLHLIYHQYDYLIHPTHMECFSLGLLEALSANIPVITTPVGGNLEAVSHKVNGYIFPTKNTHALSILIKDILNGVESISDDVSLEIRKKYTIQNMVANYMAII